jgi:uncharacterized repeat protein (TIGR03803 family)
VTASSRYGVVYRSDRAGAVTVLHTFTGPDGMRPLAALIRGADGGLYGSTVAGGAFGLGVLFRIEAGAPAPPQPPPTLTALTLSPPSVAGGQTSTGTVTLGGPAPSGNAVVTLASSDSVVSIPPTVTVTAGATSASFAPPQRNPGVAARRNPGVAVWGRARCAARAESRPSAAAHTPRNGKGGRRK